MLKYDLRSDNLGHNLYSVQESKLGKGVMYCTDWNFFGDENYSAHLFSEKCKTFDLGVINRYC